MPRVAHPDWLHKQVAAQRSRRTQHLLTNMFGKAARQTLQAAGNLDGNYIIGQASREATADIEDMGTAAGGAAAAAQAAKKRRKTATLWRVRRGCLLS